MAGRGSRLFDNKPFFTLIDMGANCYEHGLWSDERTWNIVKKKKNNSGVAPVKLCPSCEAMNPASAKVCLDCEIPFPIKKKELLKGEFIEVKATRGLNVEMDLSKASLKELTEYGKKMGYKHGWAYMKFNSQNRGLKNPTL